MFRIMGFSLSLVAIAAIALVAQETVKQKPAAAPAAQAKAQPPSAPLDPLQQTLRSYCAAFNKNDAKALAEFWATKGVYLDRQTGERTAGREALLADFQKLFKEHAGARLSAELETTRLIKPDVASVQGRSNLALPGEQPASTMFSAILVKEGDKWLLDSVEESTPPTPESASDALEELAWLIGHWVDDSPTSSVNTSVRWGTGNSFLVRSFVSEDEEGATEQGTQVIGWDARLKQFRSWSFFSDGSFGEGIWSKSGNDWLVKSTQTLEDGSLASGTQVIKRVGENTVTVQTIGREVDGLPVPSEEPTTVVRAAETGKASDGGATKR